MDRIIVLDGEEYLICRELEVEGTHYIYAVSTSSDSYTLLTEYTKNGSPVVKSVENEELVKRIMSIIAEENI